MPEAGREASWPSPQALSGSQPGALVSRFQAGRAVESQAWAACQASEEELPGALQGRGWRSTAGLPWAAQ